MFHINVRRSLVSAAVTAVACSAATASTAAAGPLQPDPCQPLRDQLDNIYPSDYPNPAVGKLAIQRLGRQLIACERQHGELG